MMHIMLIFLPVTVFRNVLDPLELSGEFPDLLVTSNGSI